MPFCLAQQARTLTLAAVMYGSLHRSCHALSFGESDASTQTLRSATVSDDDKSLSFQVGVDSLRDYLEQNEEELKKLKEENITCRLALTKVNANLDYESKRLFVIDSHREALARSQQKLAELEKEAKKLESASAAMKTKVTAEVTFYFSLA